VSLPSPAAGPGVVPNPLPGERDLSATVPLSARPEIIAYRSLPISAIETFTTAAPVLRALRDFELGRFWFPAQLADALGFDDRIDGVLQTRIDALAGLPVSLQVRPTHAGDAPAKEALDIVSASWTKWLAGPELKKLHRWGLLFRLGLGEILWDTDDEGQWTPRLKTWDPRYLYWRWDTRSFWLITADGQVEVVPGDGHWVLYAPDGYTRGWMRGLIRSLAFLYLARRWAWRDWNRHSEIHGQPIKRAGVPFTAKTEDKEFFKTELQEMASEGVVVLPDDGEGNKFTLDLLEATSQGWECFARLIDKIDECAAVNVLGQNLTTSAKGSGSYALGDVQDRIRLDRLESDALSMGECLTAQVLEPWAWYNYGDRAMAPLGGWSTKAPEDRARTATTWQALGDGLQKLRSAGLRPDLAEVARRQMIPLSDAPEKGEDVATGDIQSQALNGAQTLALLSVLDAVKAGRLPKESAIQALLTSFPANLDLAAAHRLVDPIEPAAVPEPVKSRPGLPAPSPVSEPGEE